MSGSCKHLPPRIRLKISLTPVFELVRAKSQKSSLGDRVEEALEPLGETSTSDGEIEFG